MQDDAVPGSIVKAICAIKAHAEAVKKSQRNQHGGYMFASTDDIYAALTRKMGEVGLAILSLEDECEIVRIEKDGKTSQWARIVYSFILATEDATWTHKSLRRSLYIMVNGPQTFQAAQSYAEKSFMRSTFKLPTGDMDLDSMPQADNEDDQVSLAKPGKRKSSAEGKRDGSVKLFNEIRAQLANANSRDMLMQVRTLFASEWAELPPRWSETLDEDYEAQMSRFAEAAE